MIIIFGRRAPPPDQSLLGVDDFRSPNFHLVANRVVFVALMDTLLQMQLCSEDHPELTRLTRRSLLNQMVPYNNHFVVYAKQYYAFFDAPE